MQSWRRPFVLLFGAHRRRALAPSALLLVLLCVAFALRLYQLDGQSFWDDEALSVQHASVPLPQLFFALPSDHTPGYFLLLKAWIAVAGDTDFTVRFYSVWFGTLSLAALYVLARRISRRAGLARANRVAILAVLLAAFNPFALYYAQEARMYSQLLLFSAVTLYWFARAYAEAKAQPERRSPFWIAHGVALAGAAYSHYYAGALVIAELSFLLVERAGRTRPMFDQWTRSLGVTVLLFLPWLPFSPQVLKPRTWLPPANLATYPVELWATFLAGTTLPDAWHLPLYALAAVLLAAGMFVAARRWEGRLLIALLLAPLVLVLALLTLRGQGLYARYWIVLSPAFLLLSAAALERLWMGWRMAALIAVIGWGVLSSAALANYWFDPHYSRPGWREAAQWMAAHERAGDVLLFDGADPRVTFVRYFRGASRFNELPTIRDDALANRVDETMLRAAGNAARIQLVLFAREPGRAEEWLNQHGYQGDFAEFAGVYVIPYLMVTRLAPPAVPAQDQKGEDIQVASYEVGQAKAGDLVPVAMTWKKGPKALDANLQVSLRIVNGRGEVVTALDRAPRDGFHPTSAWEDGELVRDQYALSIPDATPSGEYGLRVLMYDPASGAVALDVKLGAVQIAK